MPPINHTHMAPALEHLGIAQAELGESPVWSAAESALLWVDLHAGQLHRYDPTTGVDNVVAFVNQPLGCVAVRSSGGYVMAIRDGFATLDGHGEQELVAAVEPELPGNRMNDGACDSRGRFWAGTMADDLTRSQGSLYRLGHGAEVLRALTGISVSNGIGWSPDDESMYFIDSALRRIDVFDWRAEEGVLGERHVLIDTCDRPGVPDGLAIDEHGCLWVAFFGGGCICRFTPDGDFDREIRLPVTQVTSCAFGDSHCRTLFITTALRGLREVQRSAQEHAGDLFALEVDVAGMPAAYCSW